MCLGWEQQHPAVLFTGNSFHRVQAAAVKPLPSTLRQPFLSPSLPLCPPLPSLPPSLFISIALHLACSLCLSLACHLPASVHWTSTRPESAAQLQLTFAVPNSSEETWPGAPNTLDPSQTPEVSAARVRCQQTQGAGPAAAPEWVEKQQPRWRHGHVAAQCCRA